MTDFQKMVLVAFIVPLALALIYISLPDLDSDTEKSVKKDGDILLINESKQVLVKKPEEKKIGGTPPFYNGHDNAIEPNPHSGD